jgi:hypothetical protein
MKHLVCLNAQQAFLPIWQAVFMDTPPKALLVELKLKME